MYQLLHVCMNISNIEFYLNVFTELTKLFAMAVQMLEAATSCVRDPGCYYSTSKSYLRDRIFKFSSVHALVIY